MFRLAGTGLKGMLSCRPPCLGRLLFRPTSPMGGMNKWVGLCLCQDGGFPDSAFPKLHLRCWLITLFIDISYGR